MFRLDCLSCSEIFLRAGNNPVVLKNSTENDEPLLNALLDTYTFCTGFNLLTLIFMLPYIIMDVPIFVIAEWATLLVDIRCPRGGS